LAQFRFADCRPQGISQRNKIWGAKSEGAVGIEQLLSFLVLAAIVYFVLRNFIKRSKVEQEDLKRQQDALPPPVTGFMRIAIERKVAERPTSASRLRFSQPSPQVCHCVVLRMSFSQEALAIILRYGLRYLPLFDIPTDWMREELGATYYEASASSRALLDQPVTVTLKDVMQTQPYVYAFDTPMEADQFEQRLKNEILPKIKNSIDSAVASGERKSSETFEL
jgi:hypothetical protein